MTDAELRNSLEEVQGWLKDEIEEAKENHQFEVAANLENVRHKVEREFDNVFSAIKDESWERCQECAGRIKPHHDVVRVPVSMGVGVVHNRGYCTQNLDQ